MQFSKEIVNLVPGHFGAEAKQNDVADHAVSIP
jgi:hypothetical protein